MSAELLDSKVKTCYYKPTSLHARGVVRNSEPGGGAMRLSLCLIRIQGVNVGTLHRRRPVLESFG